MKLQSKFCYFRPQDAGTPFKLQLSSANTKAVMGGVGEKGLTVVQLSVQSIGGSLDKGVGDSTELRVISVTVDGVGSALLGEEKEFLEQHFV